MKCPGSCGHCVMPAERILFRSGDVPTLVCKSEGAWSNFLRDLQPLNPEGLEPEALEVWLQAERELKRNLRKQAAQLEARITASERREDRVRAELHRQPALALEELLPNRETSRP